MVRALGHRYISEIARFPPVRSESDLQFCARACGAQTVLGGPTRVRAATRNGVAVNPRRSLRLGIRRGTSTLLQARRGFRLPFDMRQASHRGDQRVVLNFILQFFEAGRHIVRQQKTIGCLHSVVGPRLRVVP